MCKVLALNTNDNAGISIDTLILRAIALEKEAAEYRREAANPATHPADIADFKQAAADADGAAIHIRRIVARGHYA